jgi:ketosteroid isomerase-like protein
VSAEANRELIRRLYDALDRCDGEAMAACYAPDAHFRDPAFGDLHGDEVGGMWRMLTARATDLSIELRDHDADERTGSAQWSATYTFTATGRPVENEGSASFRFANRLIVDHVDEFDFGRWARQALGPLGIAVAVLPPLRSRARGRARGELERYMAGAH